MNPPQRFERCELHREDVAQLAIEVGGLRLGPLDHADHDVAQRGQPSGDDPQRHLLPVPDSPEISAKPPSWTSCSTRQAKCSIRGVTSSPSPGSSGENGFHFSPHSASSFLAFMIRFLPSGKVVSWAGRPAAVPWRNTPGGCCFKSGGSSPSWHGPCRRRHVAGVGLDEGAAAVGVGGLVERVEGRQNGPAARVDQVDPAQVPAGVAHGQFAEVTVPCRDLEAHALQRDRAIALTLSPPGFQAKRIPKRLARRARAEHVGRLGEALDRRAGGLAVHRAVVLDLHPRLGRFVEELERQLGDAVEHRHQPALERPPERLLLAVLVGAVGERPLVDDSQAEQTLGDFLGHHRRAVIGQEGPGQAAFLDRLGESVHQVLGGLGEVPLDVAAESRVVIEDAQRDRAEPLAAGGEHLERAVVEIEMPQRPDVLGFVAADLSGLTPLFGACFAGPLSGKTPRLAAPSRAPACSAGPWHTSGAAPARDRPSPARRGCRSAVGSSSAGCSRYWSRSRSASAVARDTLPQSLRTARRKTPTGSSRWRRAL